VESVPDLPSAVSPVAERVVHEAEEADLPDTSSAAPPMPPAETPLEGLAAALADIVCWMVFYLQRCSAEEVTLEVADDLQQVVGEALRRLPPADRLAFLEHAFGRAESSKIYEYQGFLLELAETMGLE
jgi:hypothetical protein